MNPIWSLDPGLGGTGWAYWNQRRRPAAVGVIRDKCKDDTLANRCAGIAYGLKATMRVEQSTSMLQSDWHRAMLSTHIYIEMPQHMTNVRGIAAQAGAIYKLTFLVGYLSRAVFPCTVHTVTVGEWKGQLPKQLVQERIERTLGKKVCRELDIKTHAFDAVGIGLYANGIWK